MFKIYFSKDSLVVYACFIESNDYIVYCYSAELSNMALWTPCRTIPFDAVIASPLEERIVLPIFRKYSRI